MLFLLFELNKDRYLLDSAQIVKILPMVDLKEIPLAPPDIAGIFNYQGESVPVVDVSLMLLKKPSQRLLSTRLVLVEHPTENNEKRLLGLILEKAVGTLRRDPKDFSDGGVANKNAPCLGPVVTDKNGVIQWIDPDKLLSDSVRDILFRRVVEEA